MDIISIGTLSRNRLWNETAQVRTAHATTSLVRARDKSILVDPGLPAQALLARLHERTGVTADSITHVFLTNFREAHRRGIGAFPKAQILMHELEMDFWRKDISRLLEQAPEADEDHAHFQRELKLLDSIEPAPDKLADGVDLFPLFGYTPGTCGLLVTTATTTLLIAGDAIPTLDHFLSGQVLPDSRDIPAAQESFREAYEIADLIVPGHDNLFVNPRMMGM